MGLIGRELDKDFEDSIAVKINLFGRNAPCLAFGLHKGVPTWSGSKYSFGKYLLNGDRQFRFPWLKENEPWFERQGLGTDEQKEKG